MWTLSGKWLGLFIVSLILSGSEGFKPLLWDPKQMKEPVARDQGDHCAHDQGEHVTKDI